MWRAASPATASALITTPPEAGEPSDTRTMPICLVCDLIPTSLLLLLLLLFPQGPVPGPLSHMLCALPECGTHRAPWFWGAPQQVSPQGSMTPETEAQEFYLGIDLIAHSTGVKIPEHTELDLSPVFTTYLAGCVTLDQKHHLLNLTSLVSK